MARTGEWFGAHSRIADCRRYVAFENETGFAA